MPSRPAAITLKPTFKNTFSRVVARSSGAKVGRFFPGLVIAAVLCGCAAQSAYREGKDLIAQDQVEQGLQKFQEAIRLDPRGIEYKSAYAQTRERAITSYLDQADHLLNQGKYAEAEVLYDKVLRIDATNARAKNGLEAEKQNQRHLQLVKEAETALAQNDPVVAQLRLRTVLSENPNQPEAVALRRSMADAAPVAAPAESLLSASYRKPISIEFKDVALKQIFEVIARTSGLNFLFDKDVKTDQKTSIFLKNSTIESAVYFTLLTNQLEQQILDGNTILIYPNTPSKQKDYQEVIVKTFFLVNAEAKTVANTIKTIVKTRDIVIDEKLNMLILRDSPEAIRIAEKLVALHDVPEPEVTLEVEVIELKRTHLLDLGIKWPDNLVLTPLASAGGILTLNDLRTNLNGNTIAATIGPVTANARKDNSDINLLANPRIRVRNHEKAKIMVGAKLPTITTTVTSTGVSSESIAYVDVGLKLEVEPNVYLDNDVSIKVGLEVTNIVSQATTSRGSPVYEIGTRSANTVLRLKDGETQVLAGLINDEDRQVSSKIPGVGDIPILGRLFGSNRSNNEKTEIVLSITPHLVRNIIRPDAALSQFHAGTENSNRTRPDDSGGHQQHPSKGVPVRDGITPAPPAPNLGIPAPGTPSGAAGDGSNAANSGANNGPGSAPTITQVRWQGPQRASKGSTFALQLTVEPEQAITSLPLAVGFDNKILQVIGVTEGSFLRQGGAQTNFSSRIDPNGQILITAARAGNVGAGSAGDVATITFRALAPVAATRIQLLTIAPAGLNGRPITAQLPAPHVIAVNN
jgi:general secretion pathway protein D